MKNAIVTGAGRNKGIGAEICRTLAQKGVNIFFTSYKDYDSNSLNIGNDEYKQTIIECENLGVKCFFQSYDLSKEKSIQDLFTDAIVKLGNIDILVNCACFHEYDSIENLTSKLLDENYYLNVRATTLLCKGFLSNYSSENVRIVLLSSMQNKEPLTSEIAYAITKAATPILAMTLATTLALKGITINAVNPGPTEIGLLAPNNKNYIKNNPFRKLGTPQDTANIISFLVSDEGKWITGQTINSDGGLFCNNN